MRSLRFAFLLRVALFTHLYHQATPRHRRARRTPRTCARLLFGFSLRMVSALFVARAHCRSILSRLPCIMFYAFLRVGRAMLTIVLNKRCCCSNSITANAWCAWISLACDTGSSRAVCQYHVTFDNCKHAHVLFAALKRTSWLLLQHRLFSRFALMFFAGFLHAAPLFSLSLATRICDDHVYPSRAYATPPV